LPLLFWLKRFLFEMARSNRWQNENALCPFCGRVFGVWLDGACHLTEARLILIYVVTMKCGHDDCRKDFTYRPRATPLCPNPEQFKTRSASAPSPSPANVPGLPVRDD
jgi:hypothetical protein